MTDQTKTPEAADKPKTKRRGGRPEFAPTVAQRRQVSIGAAGGLAHDDIALALGISRGTLLKHFDAELSTAAARRRLSWIEAMDKAARKGNVAAQKALLATTPTISVPGLPAEPKAPAVKAAAQPAAVKQPKLGKKEEAQVQASAPAGNEWDALLPRAGTPLQ